jgi:hypothetical protein
MPAESKYSRATFIHICNDSSNLYGLDINGHVWWRKAPTTYTHTAKKDDDKVWKRLSSRCRSNSLDEDTEEETGKDNTTEQATIPNENSEDAKRIEAEYEQMWGAMAAGGYEGMMIGDV